MSIISALNSTAPNTLPSAAASAMEKELLAAKDMEKQPVQKPDASSIAENLADSKPLAPNKGKEALTAAAHTVKNLFQAAARKVATKGESLVASPTLPVTQS